jgi:alkylhydroperoxidase family enzyme
MGKLAPKVKAEIAWTCARTDRAWYALDLARRSLEQVGVSEEQAFELSADNASLPDGERAAIGFAKKLTERPQHMTDDDIESLRKHFSDHETAEIVHHVTLAAFLDRISEAALLPLEK